MGEHQRELRDITTLYVKLTLDRSPKMVENISKNAR